MTHPPPGGEPKAIEPCPFCGSRAALDKEGDPLVQVACQAENANGMCHTVGPFRYEESEAIEAWNSVASLRADLASARERCADLEMLLRASCSRHPSLRRIFAPRMSGEAYLLRHPQGGGREEDMIKLYDDGTGLPIVTDEVRAALSPPIDETRQEEKM